MLSGNNINEEYLSKGDIILYLILNTYFLDMNTKYPQDTYKENFMRTLKELNKNLCNGPIASKENYDKMISIISTLRYIDAFSLTKDEVFDYIDTKNIEIPDRWLVNKEDKKIFCSGKKILGFIRDAFSHSNINELYKISKDGNFILIDMKGTKPKPLLLKIPKEDIEILVKYTNFSSNTYPTTGMEIDDSKEINPKDPSSFFDTFTFVRFFYSKKIQDGATLYDRAAISRLDSKNEQKILLETTEKFGAEKRIHELTKDQKEEMLRKFKEIANRKDILSNRAQLLNYIIYYMKLVLPIGMYKAAFNQNENVFIFENFMSNWDNSNLGYNRYMQNIVNTYMSNYGKKQKGNLLYDAFGNNTEDINMVLKYLSDYETRKMNNFALLASFYFRSIDNQETFDCNGRILPINRLRNSFAHGRWGAGEKGDFHLYDWSGGIKNELNSSWETNISIDELLEGITKNFFKSFDMKNISIDLLQNDERKIKS